SGSATSMSVCKMAVPARPGSISGNSAVCTSLTYQYQINAVSNASSYTWSVPSNASILSGQGTTSITVKYASNFVTGTISVYASDCSGNGSAQSKTICKTTYGCGSAKAD